MTSYHGGGTQLSAGDSKRNAPVPKHPAAAAATAADVSDVDEYGGFDTAKDTSASGGAGPEATAAGAGAGDPPIKPLIGGAGAGAGTGAVTLELKLPDALASLYSVQAHAALLRSKEAEARRTKSAAAKEAEAKQREADAASIKKGTKLRALYEFVVQLHSMIDIREINSVWDSGKDAKTNPLWGDPDLDVEEDFEAAWKKHVQPYWAGKIVMAMQKAKQACARTNPAIARARAWDFVGDERTAYNLCVLIHADCVRSDARWKRLRTLNDNDAAENRALDYFGRQFRVPA